MILPIVIGIIQDQEHRILIAKRSKEQHQGGRWEFSGGKVERSETAQQALKRELYEELDIHIETVEPLIQVRHHYPDRSVFLDVYEVSLWHGNPRGKEGQRICWVHPDDIQQYCFPVANNAILRALSLPKFCLITPEVESEAVFKNGIQRCLAQGIKLIQFRAKTSTERVYQQRAKWLAQQCQVAQCQVVFNDPPADLTTLSQQGLHLTSRQLLMLDKRPHTTLLSAACHNDEELKKAEEIGVDFVFLSPVHATTSHPDQYGKGWQWFQHSVERINIPVYALGGLGKDALPIAKQHGAQGVAAISQLWGR